MSRRVRPPAVLAALAATLAALPASRAMPRDEDLFFRPEDERTAVFGSLDGGRSVFASGGSKQAITGTLDRPGFVLMETRGYGLTRETAATGLGPLAIVRFKHESSVVAGYQWILGPVYVAAFSGPELYEEQLTYDGRVRRLSQPRLGTRGQLELWANPTPTTLVTGTVVTGTTRTSVWARGSAGVALWPGAFVGPEATVYATPTYRETRWGAHLTGPALGPLTVRLSGGWMTDDASRRGSPYLGLSAWFRL